MSKTEFVYHDQTLFISLIGKYNSKNINALKRKLYNIIDQYGINEIIIDCKQISTIDNAAFYAMLDDYDIHYGGNLIIND